MPRYSNLQPWLYGILTNTKGLRKVAIGGLLGMIGVVQAQPSNFTILQQFGPSFNTQEPELQPLTTAKNASGYGGPAGHLPYSRVAFDSAGNRYGTTIQGGPNFIAPSGIGAGILWKVSLSGEFTDLHDFGGPITTASGTNSQDGSNPRGPILCDAEGDLFGTTQDGGLNGKGMLWELKTSGAYVDLHDFGGTVTDIYGVSRQDGATPYGVVEDGAGDLFGATDAGGIYSNRGIIWELTAAGDYIPLHFFGKETSGAVPGGMYPSEVALDASGDLFGTTEEGGSYNEGVVYEISKYQIPHGGLATVLHNFGGTITNYNGSSGPDGENPRGGITIDSGGNLYGAALLGGPNQNGGLLYKLTSSGVYTDLHDFGGTVTTSNGTSGPDGASPGNDVAIDSAGNLYGTTGGGGAYSSQYEEGGMVYEITATGAYLDLYDFDPKCVNEQGAAPTYCVDPESIAIDPNGDLYGPANDCLWRLTLQSGLQRFTISSNPIVGGASATGTVTLGTTAPSGGTTVSLVSNLAGVTVPVSVTVASGQNFATFNITTSSVATPSTALITARLGTVSIPMTLEIEPPVNVSSLSVATTIPSSIPAGSSPTLTVKLSGPAPSGGLKVLLAYNTYNGCLSGPFSVTVPAGASSAQVTLSSVPDSTSNSALITALQGFAIASDAVTVDPAVKSVTLAQSTIYSGQSTTGTVSLYAPAPAGGIEVVFTLDTNGVSTSPPYLTIPAGSTSATFTVTANPSDGVTVDVGAYAGQFGTYPSSTPLKVLRATMRYLSISPNSLTGGTGATGTIYLTGVAAGGGWKVDLSSNNSCVGVPSSVLVPNGASSVTFPITTSALNKTVTAVVTATDIQDSSTANANLTVHGAALISVSCSPSTVQGSSLTAVTGTVTLNGPAGPSPTIVYLYTSNKNAATVPISVTVPSGATSATFTIGHSAQNSSQSVTLTANYGGTNETTTLTVTP